MKAIFWSLLILFVFAGCNEQNEINLSGEWHYKLDKNNKGVQEKWYSQTFDKVLNLPGSLRDNNIGDNPDLQTDWTGSIYDSSWYFNPDMKKYRDIDRPKFPFWLTPEKHYKGAAWYQKQITVPKEWSTKTIILNLERPHWQTRVWLDTVLLGEKNSLSTPHTYEIQPNLIKPGQHKITVRIDNEIREIDPGINSHSISDHTQGNWNGMVGELTMVPKNKAYIDLIKLTPSIKNKNVNIEINIANWNTEGKAKLNIVVEGNNHSHKLEQQTYDISPAAGKINISYFMDDNFKTWSEFDPCLYKMHVSLLEKGKFLDKTSEIFGMREFTVKDKKFEINGIPTFLRGTTDCCVFPLTGYPPTNVEEWARIFEICKSYGLNHMRFHSYCPPEAAFIAADKAGIYLLVEGPSWAKYSTTLGDGKPIDKYLMEETKRIIDEYGNHPSFCMMAYGNEPSGNYVPYLENWVDHFRKYDPQRVFTGASTGGSWAIIQNSDFIVRAPPRGLDWKNRQPESNFDYRNKTEGLHQPYISFEMGQWCAFPNFKEIDKYTGPLKPRNFELFKEDLNDKHMGDQAENFLMASGKLQASCYKQEIEATLRTPNLAGFQLLSLNDFSGQGTALVGVLDAFWDKKGYISGDEFKAFCNSVVPLVRLPKYTFYNSEIIHAPIEVANFSGKVLKNVDVKWRLLTDKNQVLDSGSFFHNEIPIGNAIKLGEINASILRIKKAAKFTLQVDIAGYTNQWNIWGYPEIDSEPKAKGVLITANPEKAQKELEKGNSVLLLASGIVENGKDVIQYSVPAFWNTSWFRMRPPHTTGILIKNEHPALQEFPTDYYSDLQWWEISNKQQVMNLEYFPPDFRPVIQPIDTWFLNRRLAMLFEAKVDKGRLMVCSIDMDNTANRPVARQLKKSILEYMQSNLFEPKNTIDPEIIMELFEKKEREGWKSYVKANP